MIDLSQINWIKTREPQSQVTLNRPTKDLIELLNDNYELPVAISDEKGDGDRVVINQKQVTEFLTGWGSDEPQTQPDGQDTIISGVYKAEGLFIEDVQGPGSKLLVLGDKNKTTQMVFSSEWTHIRESTGYLPSGQILWGDWKTLQFTHGIQEDVKGVPVGTVISFQGRVIPEGWLLCNGGTYSSQSYGQLYQAIGTTYGGNSTNFRVPDLRGKFIRGFGGNSDALGVTQGDAIRNITGNTFAHNTWGGLVKFTQSGAFQAVYYGRGFNVRSGGGDPGHYLNFAASRVVPTASENRPQNMAMNYIIKY